MASAVAPAAGRPHWAGFILGFALGGFFDGILLHQILQWHHLLSNVQAAQDMRMQIMADGLFHALMYVLAGAGLYLLWRRRAALSDAGAGRALIGWALLGFGGWHMTDAVLSHWITGIHRIKVDSPQPLLWDLLWFFVFGVVPAVAGWVLRKPSPPTAAGPGTSSPSNGRRVAAHLGLAALVAGPLAALPSGPTDQVTVLFAPGVSPAQAFNALARLDARVLWVDRSGGMWAVSLPDPKAAWSLYRNGAMLVSQSGMAFGCFGWTQAAPQGSRPETGPV